jgi:hypothetical protein
MPPYNAAISPPAQVPIGVDLDAEGAPPVTEQREVIVVEDKEEEVEEPVRELGKERYVIVIDSEEEMDVERHKVRKARRPEPAPPEKPPAEQPSLAKQRKRHLLSRANHRAYEPCNNIF